MAWDKNWPGQEREVCEGHWCGDAQLEMGVTRPYATTISVDEVSRILHDRAVCFSSILKAVHLCRYLYGFMTVTPYEQSYLDLLELLPGEEPENLQELYEACLLYTSPSPRDS